MVEREFVEYGAARELIGFLPYLETELDRMQIAIDNRIYLAIRDGTITPETALNAWMEKIALRNLGARFRQRVAAGTTAGEKLAQALETR